MIRLNVRFLSGRLGGEACSVLKLVDEGGCITERRKGAVLSDPQALSSFARLKVTLSDCREDFSALHVYKLFSFKLKLIDVVAKRINCFSHGLLAAYGTIESFFTHQEKSVV